MTDKNTNTKIEWRLNAEARTVTSNDEVLTQDVQEIIDLNEDNRMDVLMDKFGAEALGFVIEMYGLPTRVLGIAMLDGRAIMLGDCSCRGADCRAAWGWTWKARDLDMTGHRGSLKAQPCSSAKATVFDPTIGMLYPAPYGQDPEEFYRFQRPHWGDADKIGLANFMNANVSTTEEGRNGGGDWKVD